jgi:hypothetical protein
MRFTHKHFLAAKILQNLILWSFQMQEITIAHNFKFSKWTAGFFMNFTTSGQSTNDRHPGNHQMG